MERCTNLSALALLGLLLLGASSHVHARIYLAGPDDYRSMIDRLEPGDTLALAAGDYRDGLRLHGIRGEPDARIHIAGPEHGTPAVIHPRPRSNVVSLKDAAWLTIRNLTIDADGKAADGVKLEGTAEYGHHITLSDLHIRNLAANQQIVGISTKAPAYGWIVRNVVIEGAGTGMYFGRPDGSAPFVGGIIENNLVTDPIGYALQIKQQGVRADIEGLPTEVSQTIIRHNVFAKGDNSSTGSDARPNVLLGHFPSTGPGSSDRYVFYGNFVYNNPTERLFQGEGNIALYNNLLVNPSGAGLAIMPHKGDPRRIAVFHNTLLAADGTGMFLRSSDATERFEVAGNAVFAATPFSGSAAPAGGNVTASYAAAETSLRAPFAAPGELDLRARGDRLDSSNELPFDLLWGLPGVANDFTGQERTGTRVGAYDNADDALGWPPSLVRQPLRAAPLADQ